ncbi:unnamed protein product [Amoebophrya sp. A25]|nr:unnamed protein product [Amoebophrya sp. A25]|eukprot:GSA25T00011792001.1
MSSLLSVGGSGALASVIKVVDDLRDVGLQQIISLPRIVVVGSQSSGKSSVLESVVGYDFLPRGDGVVTRRPLELRLVHVSEAVVKEEGHPAWGVFGGGDNTKFYNFDKIREHIEFLTDKVCGANKAIIDDPITLTVYGKDVPDLTLIDLPGMTKIAAAGSDQTGDVARITREMTERYIRDDRTIVLAVSPANADITTSVGLKYARQFDPEGVRTIGVLTKLDIMDAGTNAIRTVKGEDVHLRLGFIGVKNRSKQDIMDNMTVAEALKMEEKWFAEHPTYSRVEPGYFGTKALVDRLMKVLSLHIRWFLPKIKRDVFDLRQKIDLRLQELGDGIPEDANVKTQLVWRDISSFCEMIDNSIKGKYDPKLSALIEKHQSESDEAPSVGAQVRRRFSKFLEDIYEEDITKDLTDDDINQSLRNFEGDALPGFPSPDTFEMLISPHLSKLIQPSLDCLADTVQCISGLAHRVSLLVFYRFPELGEKVFELSNTIIDEERMKTKAIVEDTVNSSTGYFFTNDDLYLIAHGAMQPTAHGQGGTAADIANRQAAEMQEAEEDPSVGGFYRMRDGVESRYADAKAYLMGNKQKNFQSKYSQAFLRDIRDRLEAYFKLVVRSLREAIPKAIGCFLVRSFQEKLKLALTQNFQSADSLDKILLEPAHIRDERKSLVEQKVIIRKAHQVLSRDIEMQIGETDSGLDALYTEMLYGKQAAAGAGMSGGAARAAARASPMMGHQPVPPSSGMPGAGGMSGGPNNSIMGGAGGGGGMNPNMMNNRGGAPQQTMGGGGGFPQQVHQQPRSNDIFAAQPQVQQQPPPPPPNQNGGFPGAAGAQPVRGGATAASSLFGNAPQTNVQTNRGAGLFDDAPSTGARRPGAASLFGDQPRPKPPRNRDPLFSG